MRNLFLLYLLSAILNIPAFFCNLYAQEEKDPNFAYKPLEEFDGDTVQFLFYNFLTSPYDYYKGKTVEELLEYVRVPYEHIYSYGTITSGKPHLAVTSVMINLKDFPRYVKNPEYSEPKVVVDLEKRIYNINVTPKDSYLYNKRYLNLIVWLKPVIFKEEIPENGKEEREKLFKSRTISGVELQGNFKLLIELKRKEKLRKEQQDSLQP